MENATWHRQLYDALLCLPPDPEDRHTPRTGCFEAPHPGPALRWVGELEGTPRAILGISAFYHDAAAALVVDGELRAAVQEERFTRRKNDAGLPRRAAEQCCRLAEVRPEDVDLIAFYEEPFLKLDRMARSLARFRPDFETLRDHLWFEGAQRNSILQDRLPRDLGIEAPLVFVRHHHSHLASAFYPSPFREAAGLVIDGVGEWATTTLAVGRGHELEVLEEIRYPNSLGLLYSTLTGYLGFAVNSDEYKVMALAAFGEPRYRDRFEKLLEIFEDGSFRLDLNPFSWAPGEPCVDSQRLKEALGVPPRARGGPLSQEHRDLACSLQRTLEDAMLGLQRRLHRSCGLDALVMAGGVALNGVANYRNFVAGPFRQIFIQPAAGDAGGALGAALYAANQLRAGEPPRRGASWFDPHLGPTFSQEQVESILGEVGADFEVLPWDDLLSRVAKALAAGRVVGWFQGRMEIGPRALGSRSILAHPGYPGMKDRVNHKIKFREGFRPFAPILPEEEATRFLDCSDLQPPLSYMQFVVPVAKEERSRLAAVLHVDGTTRPQLINRRRQPRLWELLRAFETESGTPVLLNTSFNLAGEPIVCSPRDAYKTFRWSEIDLLVVERCLVGDSELRRGE